MGYYADLIKEKRNARDYDEINKLSKEIKQIVSELRRKYTHIRQTDDVNFLLDVLHDRRQQIPQSDKNKAEHAMQLDETRRRMSVAPRDWGNSKEEKQNYRETGKMEEFRYEIEDTKDIGGIFYRGVLRDKTNQIFFATEWDKSKDRVKRELQEQARYYSRKNSKEEKGYYAKLAEEKSAKKNAKDSSVAVYDRVFKYDSEDRSDKEKVYNEIQAYGQQVVDRLTDEWNRESQKFQQKIDKARKEIQQALRNVR